MDQNIDYKTAFNKLKNLRLKYIRNFNENP